jgi:aspartate carbamoyltransferase catalytic subunit
MPTKLDALDAFSQRSILSMRDFTKEEILALLDYTQTVKQSNSRTLLDGKMMASCFFEPSTRTRLSFEAAMKTMGGDVIGFAESKTTSMSKNEALFDTIKVIGQYADLIVLRHPLDGSVRYATEATDKPIINAGDGANQHPTQTLLDLFTMRECHNRLEDLHIAFVGDLKYGRTVHSLVQAASLFNMRMYFIALEGLELPRQIADELKQKGILFSHHLSLHDIIPKLDIVYMTRIQEERMNSTTPALKNYYKLKKPSLEGAKQSLKIFHPLPRVNEIDRTLDETPYAHYFKQAHNGIYLRQALLSAILGCARRLQ